MSVVAIKTGPGFVVILGIFGVLQSQAVTESLLLFAAAGVIPGTSVELSPDMTLLVASAILIALAVIISRKHIFYRTTVETISPRPAQDERQENGELDTKKRVSYLRWLAFNVRLAIYMGGDGVRKMYFRLKIFGHGSLILSKTALKKLVVILLNFDYVQAQTSIREKLEQQDFRLRRLTHGVVGSVNSRADKTFAYLVRLILH